MAEPPPGGEDDICYEVEMMGAFVDLLSEKHSSSWALAKAGTQERLLYTAVFEASLLHARNVFEFAMVPPTSDKRSARTFAPTWDYKEAGQRVGKRYGAICTQLSHIGRAREDMHWRPLDVAREALAEFDAVLEIATRGDVARLRSAASNARAAIKRVEGRQGPLMTTTN